MRKQFHIGPKEEVWCVACAPWLIINPTEHSIKHVETIKGFNLSREQVIKSYYIKLNVKGNLNILPNELSVYRIK